MLKPKLLYKFRVNGQINPSLAHGSPIKNALSDALRI